MRHAFARNAVRSYNYKMNHKIQALEDDAVLIPSSYKVRFTGRTRDNDKCHRQQDEDNEFQIPFIITQNSFTEDDAIGYKDDSMYPREVKASFDLEVVVQGFYLLHLN